MITTPLGYEVTLAYAEAVRHWPFRGGQRDFDFVKGHARLDEYGLWVAEFGDYTFDKTGWTSNHEINEHKGYSLGFESAESLFGALGYGD